MSRYKSPLLTVIPSEAKNPTLGAETLRSAQGTRRDFAIVLPVQGLGRFRSLSLLLTSVEGIIGLRSSPLADAGPRPRYPFRGP